MNHQPSLRSDLYSAFYRQDPAEIVRFLQRLATHYQIPQPPHILDIGCGTGRMLQPLAGLGWQVTGMEPDTDYFNAATEVANQLNNVTLEQGGFDDINAVNEFDLIAAINGPFYYLLTLEERIEAVRRMFNALKPGGIIFLEIANFLWILQNFKEVAERSAIIDGRKVNLVVYHSVDFHESIFQAEELYTWNDPEEGQVRFSEIHKFAIILVRELLQLLKQQGCKNIQTYNSYTARHPEKINGARILVAAQKPA